jgi:hypothetical protein
MTHLNKKNNNRYIIRTTAVATIFTLAIMIAAASSMMMATPMLATAATTTTEEATATTTTLPPEGIIELSPQPVYQERQITVGETAVNQTHVQLAISGNGTLTLPNITETISTTSTGSIIVSLDGTGAGKEVITTEDGTESATATIYAIARFGMEGGRGIVIALLDTDSTGRLAPLDGMILAGQIEFPPPPEQATLITLWEWQSGIPLPPSPTTPPTEEPSPLTETTTANATTTTTAPDTNGATPTAPAPAPEQAEGGEGEEQQQQQTTIAPNPLFE